MKNTFKKNHLNTNTVNATLRKVQFMYQDYWYFPWIQCMINISYTVKNNLDIFLEKSSQLSLPESLLKLD